MSFPVFPPRLGSTAVDKSGGNGSALDTSTITTASGLASAFFSPSKAAEQEAVATEWARVLTWLDTFLDTDTNTPTIQKPNRKDTEDSSFLTSTSTHQSILVSTPTPSSSPVRPNRLVTRPDFERSDLTLHVLQTLMNTNERANRDLTISLAVLEEAAESAVIPTNPDHPDIDQPVRKPRTYRQMIKFLLNQTNDALGPEYQNQISALARLVGLLGLPCHESADKSCAIADVGGSSADLESIGQALVSYELFTKPIESSATHQLDPDTFGIYDSSKGDDHSDCQGGDIAPMSSGNPALDPVSTPLVGIGSQSVNAAFKIRRNRMMADLSNLSRLESVDGETGPVGEIGSDGHLVRHDGSYDTDYRYIGSDPAESGADLLDQIHISTVEMNRQIAKLKASIEEHESKLRRKHNPDRAGIPLIQTIVQLEQRRADLIRDRKC